ncbi:AFG1-like ATPase-domain-containing protein [Phlyctochytrium arcticum]|nr:AFG1-like ATPase-domain-containing protein [Phlyctochytrium arcticum]
MLRYKAYCTARGKLWPTALLHRRQFATDIQPIGPQSEYFRLITNKSIRPSEEQLRLVVQLQKLCEELIDYQPPEIPGRMVTSSAREGNNEQSAAPILGASPSSDLVYVPSMNEYFGPKGLWIHGNVGTGKTLAMDLFYNSLPISRKKRVHFNAFTVSAFAKLHAWNNRPRPHNLHVTELVAQDLLHEAWLLCFDEFQITDVATASIMRQILRHMFVKGAVMVATSNRAPEDLYKGGFHREHQSTFVDLLRDRCEVAYLRSKTDYRSEALKENLDSPDQNDEKRDVYFLLDSEESVQRFVLRVTEVLAGKTVRRESFQSYGRTVSIPKAAGNIAIFTFDELCGQPWAPADYLLLCCSCPTIILQSVPVMGLVQKNEARRFITFIDACYENRCQLILSAEAAPDQLFITTNDGSPLDNNASESADSVMHKEMLGDLLGMTPQGSHVGRDRLAIFTGEEERFAFRRAVSRLYEMQSRRWATLQHMPQAVEFAEGVGRAFGEEPTLQSLEAVSSADNGADDAVADFIAAQSAPSPVSSTTNDTTKRRHTPATDDFGDEASFAGYLKMYERFNPDNADPIKILAERDGNRPTFLSRHIWSLGEWGSKAGKWGQGVAAFIRQQEPDSEEEQRPPRPSDERKEDIVPRVRLPKRPNHE